MKRGIWVGGLILSLGGWTSDLLAQEGAWRPAPSGPVPVTLAPSELKPCPAVTIGRPIPVLDESNYPALLPTPPASGIVRTSYQPPLFPTGSAAPSATDLPGGSKLPTWDEVEGAKPTAATEGTFASDRSQPAPEPTVAPPGAPAVAAPSLVKQVGLATSVPDAGNFAPVSSGWGAPLPTMLPTNGDPAHGNPYPCPYPMDGAPNELNPMSTHFYANAEYLLWWTKRDTTPALVTTSTDGTGVNNEFGFLNQASTTVLNGGPYGGGPSSGFRANAGLWLDTCNEEAIEIGGFFLAPKTGNFSASTDQFAVLARPFFNVNNNTEFAELVGFPGISTGHITISTPSSLWGVDSNLRCNLCMTCDHRFDVFVGIRYLNLFEGLNIQEVIQGSAAAPAPFTNALTTVTDSFTTHNQFYGGQIGFDSEWKRGQWSLDLRGKLALGATEQQVNINGIETITPPGGATSTFNGGLLALPSNIGNHSKTEFSVVPEVGLTLGYQLTSTIRLYAGYNFLYWTNVVRPGEQIDRNLDVTQIPNFNIAGAKPISPSTPNVPFQQSNYWAQGIMIGIEFRY